MKRLLAVILVLGLVAFTGPDTYAGKGSSSGGRSFSSGGSHPSVSSSRPSYSSGSKPSFSSGSRPSYSSGSKPSSSSGSRPSFSGGGSKPSSSPSVKPGGSSSRPSYSSGGGSNRPTYSNPSSPTVAPKPSASSKPGTGYSSGGKTYTPVAAPDAGSKPKGGVFDGNAAAAQKRVESKANYVKGSETKPTYTTPAGTTRNIDSGSKSVQTIRNIDHQTYITRETRIYTVFAPYYGYPVVVYNDPFNTFFWFWMLDQSLERRAMWAYHHRAEMDSARYQALLAKDAKLEARIKQLEAEKVAVDPSYIPPGVDYDLQYTDDYVDSIVNPHTTQSSGGWFGKFMWWTFMILLGIVVVWLFVYLVFMKRW